MNQSNMEKLTEEAVIAACRVSIGPIDSDFLCRSVSVLNPPDPIVISENSTIAEASRLLKNNSLGCVLITSSNGSLVGVFSERDFMSKVFESNLDLEHTGIRTVMTSQPFTAHPDSPIAYCLSLMSEGGFRHLPLVDSDNMPIGIVSVRDVINYLVENAVKGLLGV